MSVDSTSGILPVGMIGIRSSLFGRRRTRVTGPRKDSIAIVLPSAPILFEVAPASEWNFVCMRDWNVTDRGSLIFMCMLLTTVESFVLWLVTVYGNVADFRRLDTNWYLKITKKGKLLEWFLCNFSAMVPKKHIWNWNCLGPKTDRSVWVLD